MMWNGFGWGWMLGGIGMIIFWGVIIFLIVWGVKKLTEHRGGTTEMRSPMDIVKERYARGEISKEQFEQIKKDLSG